MTWPQLRGHLRELQRRRTAQAEAATGKTGVDSWDGREHDTFFANHFQGRRHGVR